MLMLCGTCCGPPPPVCPPTGGFPASASLSCGSFTGSFNSGVNGYQSTILWTPPTGEVIDPGTGCVVKTTARILVTVTCLNGTTVSVFYNTFMADLTFDCGVKVYVSDTYVGGAPAKVSSTITSYTSSPFLITGTFNSAYDNPSFASYPGPPMSGSFTIS